MRIILAVVVCSLLTTADGIVPSLAQVDVPQRALSMPAPLSDARSALGGITVPGRAAITVPPDSMHFELRINPSVRQGPNLPPSASSPTELELAIVKALHQVGVDDASIAQPIGGYYNLNVTPAVVGSIARPTRERVLGIANEALGVFPPTLLPQLANTQLSTSLRVRDCSAAEARAEVAAIADAKRRAFTYANAARVHLGKIVAIDDRSFGPSPGCALARDAADSASFFVNQPTYGELLVTVTANVAVTFAVR